jgi:hypothetical protein
VCCWLCHHRAILSADRWPDHLPVPSFGPPHGLHPLRHHRCRRPAELAGATGAAEWPWCRAVAVSAEGHRALRLLAGSPLGVTEAIMLAHGFTTDLLVKLVHQGLATATPEQRPS